MASESEILDSAQEFLVGEVSPKAAELDSEPEALRQALKGLCERGLMALRRPEKYGGPAMSERGFRAFQESVARYSGSLAFLQTQHQSAVSLLGKAENEALAAEYLPLMHDGTRLVGIGFSQLRRYGPPMLRAEVVEGGYLLNGQVPWITGFGFYPEFLIGAALPDGRSIFGIVPFTDQEGIKFSPPMQLAAMQSAQTVTAELTNWFMPDERWAFTRPERWIHLNDQLNITLQGWFAVGCARGSIDVIEQAASKRPNPALPRAAVALSTELDQLRADLLEAQNEGGEDVTALRLRLRARAIELCVRCAHAAISASGGAANGVGHPAQRLYREALVYTVSAQTEAIQTATLELLTS